MKPLSQTQESFPEQSFLPSKELGPPIVSSPPLLEIFLANELDDGTIFTGGFPLPVPPSCLAGPFPLLMPRPYTSRADDDV